MLKNLFMALLALTLSGCITYYDPAPGTVVYSGPYDEGVYYASEDPQVSEYVGVQYDYGFNSWWYSGFGAYSTGYGWQVVYHYPLYSYYPPWYGGWSMYWGYYPRYYYPRYPGWVFYPPYHPRPDYHYPPHPHKPHDGSQESSRHEVVDVQDYHRSEEQYGVYSARNPRTSMVFDPAYRAGGPASSGSQRSANPSTDGGGTNGLSGIALAPPGQQYEQRTGMNSDSNTVVRSGGNFKPGVSRTTPAPSRSNPDVSGFSTAPPSTGRRSVVTPMPKNKRIFSTAVPIARTQPARSSDRMSTRRYSQPSISTQRYTQPSTGSRSANQVRSPSLSRSAPVSRSAPRSSRSSGNRSRSSRSRAAPVSKARPVTKGPS